MSWTGLKKAINRAGTHVLLKTGQIDEAATDLEFDYEEKRYRAMETASTKLHKELRHYKDSLTTLVNAQESVGEVLSGFYGTDKNNVAHIYHDAMKELQTTGLGELEHPYLQTVLNPIQRFNSYYVDVNEAIKKRAHKKLDYSALKSKVQKLEANPSEDPKYEPKLKDSQAQLVEIEETYSRLNSQLKDELPKLVEMRVPYLNPLFEAFVKVQLRFFHENYTKLNDVQQHLDAQTREDYISGNLEKRIDNVLHKIQELNIAL